MDDKTLPVIVRMREVRPLWSLHAMLPGMNDELERSRCCALTYISCGRQGRGRSSAARSGFFPAMECC